MLTMIINSHKLSKYKQRGAAAVEFAIIALLFFILLFGIFEFGRMFYVFNTVQEVTRRAAREAVVRWVDNSYSTTNPAPAKELALFGGTAMPAGAEITVNNINIEYLETVNGTAITTGMPPSPSDNIAACIDSTNIYDCIAYVRVSITGATYAPMVSLFPFLSIPIPASTVTMPAESMGYSG